ncbi:hypothetical protein VC83_06955 [Pseudogymnoascus destructans]|uniref:Uncharacterized protein n=2 Tax=Pseudogymnoascus destructans TaxID=655981 RepID=L8FR24_PSED2|nr:uncharacterized protein VC83_06955 [Pseudogymnoascus destructans]ELR02116.1 hypothetical protein GMDG_05275 [Pseudogymnoascus destructans 20631-21]OAF56811.1 hypothetical protein VC83_06955 [Pseudogymnoascus destructans]
MAELEVKVPIEAGDGGIKKIRSFLAEWAAGRRSKAQNGPVTASSQLDWPDYPPQTPVPFVLYPDSDDESSRKAIYHVGGHRYVKNAIDAVGKAPMKSLLANNEN